MFVAFGFVFQDRFATWPEKSWDHIRRRWMCRMYKDYRSSRVTGKRPEFVSVSVPSYPRVQVTECCVSTSPRSFTGHSGLTLCASPLIAVPDLKCSPLIVYVFHVRFALVCFCSDLQNCCILSVIPAKASDYKYESFWIFGIQDWDTQSSYTRGAFTKIPGRFILLVNLNMQIWRSVHSFPEWLQSAR